MGKKNRQKKTRGIVRTSPSAGTKSFQLDAETVDALKEQLTRFREKFGRDPEPDDPVFFNPDADAPEPITPAQDDAL